MMEKIFFLDDYFWVTNKNLVNLFEEEKLKGYGAYAFIATYLKHLPSKAASIDVLPSLSKRAGTKTKYLVHIIKDYHLFNINNNKFSIRPFTDNIYHTDLDLLTEKETQTVNARTTGWQMSIEDEQKLQQLKLLQNLKPLLLKELKPLLIGKLKPLLFQELTPMLVRELKPRLVQELQLVVPGDLNNEVHDEVSHEILGEVRNEFCKDIHDDVHDDVHDEVHDKKLDEVHDDVHDDIHDEVHVDLDNDAKPVSNFESVSNFETRNDLQNGVPNVTQNEGHNVPQNEEQNVTHNGTINVTHNGVQNVPQNEAKNDVQNERNTDAHVDVLLNEECFQNADIQCCNNDVEPTDMQPNSQLELHLVMQNDAQNVTHNGVPNILQNGVQNVTHNGVQNDRSSSRACVRTRTPSSPPSSLKIKEKNIKKEKQVLANENIQPVENLPESLLVVKVQPTKHLSDQQQQLSGQELNDQTQPDQTQNNFAQHDQTQNDRSQNNFAQPDQAQNDFAENDQTQHDHAQNDFAENDRSENDAMLHLQPEKQQKVCLSQTTKPGQTIELGQTTKPDPTANLHESGKMDPSFSLGQLGKMKPSFSLDESGKRDPSFSFDRTNDEDRTNDVAQSSKLHLVAESRLPSDSEAKDQPVNNQPEIKQSKQSRAATSSPKNVSNEGGLQLLSNRENLEVEQPVQLLGQVSTLALAPDASQVVHHSRARPKSSTQHATAQQPFAQQPFAQQPFTQHATAKRPSAKQSFTKQPTAKQPSVLESSVPKSSTQQLSGTKVATLLHVVPDGSVRTVYSFDELVEKMLHSSCYMEVVAIHSRLGEKFLQHLNLIVKLFKNHVYLRGKLENMTSLGEVQSYFSNFLIPGSSNSKEVIRAIYDAEREDVLKSSSAPQADAKACPIGKAADKATFAARHTETFGLYATSPNMDDNPYRFEYVEDGKRMYCGREIPPEAPPRPSRNSVWNPATEKWGR